METVKSLLVKFGTDTKDMEAGFKKADGLIVKNAEKFKQAGKVMVTAGAAITGAIALMVRGYVKAGDEIHKMAARTGFSAVALSELKHAAEISGASLSDVEKGVKKMSKTILDASDGLATYVRAFDRIGLSAEELIDLSPEEQFDKISKAIAGVENPTIRAATAQEIFGRAGTKLLPLFAAGEKGLDALRKKAHELGIVFDQEAADKAAVLNDALLDLKGSFVGASRSIVEALIPTVTALAEKVTKIVVKVKDWIEENPVLTGTIVKVAAAIGAVMLAVGPLLIALPGISIAIGAIGAASLATVAATAAWVVGIGLLVAAVAGAVTVINQLRDAKEYVLEADERLQAQTKKLRDKMLEASDAVGLTREEFIKLEKAYDGNLLALNRAIRKGEEGVKLQEALKKVGGEHAVVINEQVEAQEEAAKAAAEVNVVLEKQGTIIQKLISPWNELEQAAIDLTDAFVTGKITMTEYMAKQREAEAEVKRLANEFDDLDMAIGDSEIFIEDWGDATDAVFKQIGLTAPSEMGKVKDSLVETIDIMETRWGAVIGGLGDVFGNFIFDVMDKNSTLTESFAAAWEGVKNVFKSVIADMAQEYLQNFLKKIVTKGVTAFADVGKNILDLGKSVTKSITSIGSAASGVFVGVGAAVGTFLGSLIGKKMTGFQKAMQKIGLETVDFIHDLLNISTWFLPKLEEILWAVSETKDISRAMLETGWSISEKLSALGSYNRRMIDHLKTASESLRSIQKTSEITAVRLKSLAGFKAGGNFRPIKESLITVHPGEDVRITPDNKRPVGDGGGNTYNLNFNVTDQLDPYTAAQMVKNIIAPAVVELVRGNAKIPGGSGGARTQFKEALKI